MSRLLGKYNLIKYNDLEAFYCSGIIQHDSINKKGTKIKLKAKFIYFIDILIKKLYILEDDYIIPFFETKNILIPDIILNGYIYHELTEQENQIIFNLLYKIFPFIMKKQYFFFVYNKLSKIYRKLNSLKNRYITSNDIILFKKVFYLWKFFFSYDDMINLLQNKYIYFYGKNAININISSEKDNIYNNLLYTEISIIMHKTPLFYILNKNKNNFSFIKLYRIDENNNKNEIFIIKYKDIEENNNIKEIKFIIYKTKICYIINNNIDNIKELIKNIEIKFNYIKLLNNFCGKISFIKIIRKYENEKYISVEIKPGFNDLKIDYKKNFNETDILKENIEIKLKNFYDKTIFYKNYPEILYEDIKYYGGIESFVPILKIFYKIFSLLNPKKIEKIHEIKNLYKNFFKIIINIINYSENNLLNFNDIIIPLIGALSEIDEVIADKDTKNEIYKDINFINIFILISISSCPLNSKNIFQKIFDIRINNINYICTDIRNSEKVLYKYNTSLDWYCLIIFFNIEFIILTSNNFNKIPKGFFSILLNIYNAFNNNIFIVKNINKKEKIKAMIECFFAILDLIFPGKIKNMESFKKIDDFNLLKFINEYKNEKENLIKLIFYLMKILFNLNKMGIIKYNKDKNDKNNNIKEESSFSKFYILFLSLKGIFNIKNYNNIDNNEILKLKKLKEEFKELMKDFVDNKSLILEILDENEEIYFIKEEEKILNEFISYHKQYRHLIQELFIFNRPWSSRKLFFSDEKSNLKYKNINYYTSNFQRPILYPILDYYNHYPKFSHFKLKKNFYLDENISNNEYEYDFDFKNNLLDKYNQNSIKEIINLIEKKYIQNIQIYDVCLVKRTHHIKGKLFTIMIKGILGKIFFYSYSKEENDKYRSCNNSKKNLCYGALFPCSSKDFNINISINIKDIKLIIRRIYFYKKSGIEIFYGNKSYFFNFYDEKNSENIINLLVYYSQKEFLPININGHIIGFTKIFIDIFNNNEYNEKNNDIIFIKDKYVNDLVNNWIKFDKNNNIVEKRVSSFDSLILLNLLGNRSFIDIYQYPIFPILFFYDLNDNQQYINIQRDLENHIGFQIVTKNSENRKKKIINIFESKKYELENDLINEENAYYFESNFSNIKYTCNYLLRIFPYTFMAIELQGDGFDYHKNLFTNIEDTFYSISCKENDLRELIPEFFYFPEIFLNINLLNFNLNKDNENNDSNYINDVKLPQEFLIKNNIIKNKDNNINHSNDSNSSNDDKEEKFYFYCKFISKMRKILENNYLKILKWKDLIFGEKQKFLGSSLILEKNRLFKPESYITFDSEKKDILKNESKSKEIMNSIEFGILPTQIINIKNNIEIDLDEKLSYINKNDKINYIKNNIAKNKNLFYSLKNEKEKEEIICFNIKDDINSIYNININKKKSKIEIIYDNNRKIKREFYENISLIKYFHYNKRLNMLIISSSDGFLLLYMLPGKLINVIKHPKKNNYFIAAFLCSNPFPCIIAYDFIDNFFYSFSLNGLFIKKINLNDFCIKSIEFFPLIGDEYGKYDDVLIIQLKNNEINNIMDLDLNNINNYIFLNIPFFELIDYNSI